MHLRPWEFLSILYEVKTVCSVSVNIIGRFRSRQLDLLYSLEDISQAILEALAATNWWGRSLLFNPLWVLITLTSSESNDNTQDNMAVIHAWWCCLVQQAAILLLSDRKQLIKYACQLKNLSKCDEFHIYNSLIDNQKDGVIKGCQISSVLKNAVFGVCLH